MTGEVVDFMGKRGHRDRLLRVILALRQQASQANPQQAATLIAQANSLIQKNDIKEDELTQFDVQQEDDRYRSGDIDLDEYLADKAGVNDLGIMFMFGSILKFDGLSPTSMATKVGGIRKMNAKGHLHWAITFSAAKQGYDRNGYAQFCNAVKYHPRDTKVKRYVVIGKRASRLYADIDKLPDAFDTLWKLACLHDEEYAWVHDDPRFNPSMKASDIKTILRTPHMGGKFNYKPEPFKGSTKHKQEPQPTFFGDCLDMDKTEIRRLYADLNALRDKYPTLAITFSDKFEKIVGRQNFSGKLYSRKFESLVSSLVVCDPPFGGRWK